MRKRNHVIFCRLNDAEYAELQNKLSESGLTLQSYIINSALTAKVSSSKEVAVLKNRNDILSDYDKQLRGMATNINQLAHIANGYGELPTSRELMDILKEIRSLRKEVNEEWRSTRQSITRQKVTER